MVFFASELLLQRLHILINPSPDTRNSSCYNSQASSCYNSQAINIVQVKFSLTPCKKNDK